MQIPKRKAEERRVVVPDDPHMTPAAIERMRVELERLEKVDRKVVAEEVSRTGAMGDLSENAGYQMAKQRLRGINNRILTLRERLKRAIPIEKKPGESDVVAIGSVVTVRANGEEKIYTILGSLETNPSRGYISRTSPIGVALLGGRVGDKVTAQTPKGEAVYEILRIE